MEVKPILFSTPMVQAILDGRKTVTRRIVNPRYREDEYGFQVIKDVIYPDKWGNWYVEKVDEDESEFCPHRYINPPYCPGYILYVRETWRVGAWDIHKQMMAFDYKDGTCGSLVHINNRTLFEQLVDQSREDARRAGCIYNGADFVWEKGKSPCRWYPSIHMSREAARIWLRVKDVWVERLQEMTASQADKEGVRLRPEYDTKERRYILAFADLWDSTIKKSDFDIYGWAANPWVWVIEFERCKKPGGV